MTPAISPLTVSKSKQDKESLCKKELVIGRVSKGKRIIIGITHN